MPRKKKNQKPEKPMFRFHLLDETYVEQTTEPDTSGDGYCDRGETYTDHSILGICPDKHGDIVTDIDVPVDGTAYLVYVVWSTGDSFGHDACKNLTAVHLFDSREKAEACAKAIEDHAELKRRLEYQTRKTRESRGFSEFSVKYIGNDGTEMTEYAGWNGYFESVDRVDVEQVTHLAPRDVTRLKRERRIW